MKLLGNLRIRNELISVYSVSYNERMSDGLKMKVTAERKSVDIDQLRKFFNQFKEAPFIPKGIYKFKSFEEVDTQFLNAGLAVDKKSK